MELNDLDINDGLHEEGLPNVERLASRAYHVTSQRLRLANLPLGTSRFGGTPDVPIGFEWPIHRDRPLTFLAQFDLTKLASTELPGSGWLLFFYDVAEQPMGFDPLHLGGAKVVYLNVDRDNLSRIEHPDVTSAGGPYECCSLTVTATVSLPDAADSILKANPLEQYGSPANGYCAVMTNQKPIPVIPPCHQLLGHPQLLQGDMRGQCQLVTSGTYCGDPSGYQGKRSEDLLARAATEWQLLLQLDTDEVGPDFLWNESGRIYFWIRRTDLEALAFDKAWLILQHST